MKKSQSKGAVLVVIAHPDDETLGVGGAIARHVDEGRRVSVLSLTDGVGARGTSRTAASVRARAADRAAAILGFKWLERASFPDNALDTVPLLDIVTTIESAKEKVKPTLVYTHFPHDLNIDHRIVCQAVMTAFRPQPGEICAEIRACEISSSTDYGEAIAPMPFAPNMAVAIAHTWRKKLKALQAYSEEMRPFPHTRSYEALEALAVFRGTAVGLPMAEAFQILRMIER